MVRHPPAGDGLSGLCRADSLIVEFQPVLEELSGPETPVEAVGVQARRSYHLLERPKAYDPARLSWPARRSLDRICARRKLFEDAFFQAEDEEIAQHGAFLLHAVLDGVRTDGAAPGFNCTVAEAKSPADCPARLRRLDLERLEEAERCDTLPTEPSGAACISLFIDDHDQRIRHDYMTGRIAAVELNQLLVMRHGRLD